MTTTNDPAPSARPTVATPPTAGELREDAKECRVMAETCTEWKWRLWIRRAQALERWADELELHKIASMHAEQLPAEVKDKISSNLNELL